MKLLKYLEFISESYKEKISKENLDFFTTEDPSRTKKYVEWCSKQLFDNKSLDRDDIISLVKWFDTNLPRLENKDIYTYDYESLRDLNLKEGDSKTKLNSLNSEDFITVIDNEEIKIVYIKTFKAAEKWNAVNPNGGRSWCIGRNESTFDNYCKTSTFYYIWLKASKDRFCVQVTNNETTVWNSLDQSSSLESHKILNNYKNSFKFIKLSLKSQLLKLNHTVLPDGIYHFHCNVNVSNLGLKSLKDLEISISKVDGYFKCDNNKLITLEGCPKSVGGSFECYNNQLTTLEGSPETVGRSFSCSYNQLTTLEGSPKRVRGSFYCNNNQLTTLERSPKNVGEYFNCSNKLTTLEGSPKRVRGNFNCSYNKLTTLEGSPETVGGNFYCHGNKLPKNITKPKGVKGNFIGTLGHSV